MIYHCVKRSGQTSPVVKEAKRVSIKHSLSAQLPDVIDPTAAISSFRCQRAHMLNLIHPSITSLANSLLSYSIISEDVYHRVSNSNRDLWERSGNLLDCINARIKVLP